MKATGAEGTRSVPVAMPGFLQIYLIKDMPLYDFDQDAATYDDFYADSPGREIDLLEKKLVERFLPKLNRDEILEIGCGTGHWTRFFSEKGFFVYGLDISEKMLEKARDKKIPNARFTPGRAEDLPFEEHSFSNIVCITSLEFVDDAEKVRSEINRVLKSGGTLLIGALNENSFFGRNKNNFEVFKNARFFTKPLLHQYLEIFGTPEIKGCVVQDENGNILDLEEGVIPEDRRSEEGAFLVGFVKKTK